MHISYNELLVFYKNAVNGLPYDKCVEKLNKLKNPNFFLDEILYIKCKEHLGPHEISAVISISMETNALFFHQLFEFLSEQDFKIHPDFDYKISINPENIGGALIGKISEDVEINSSWEIKTDLNNNDTIYEQPKIIYKPKSESFKLVYVGLNMESKYIKIDELYEQSNKLKSLR